MRWLPLIALLLSAAPSLANPPGDDAPDHPVSVFAALDGTWEEP